MFKKLYKNSEKYRNNNSVETEKLGVPNVNLYS